MLMYYRYRHTVAMVVVAAELGLVEQVLEVEVEDVSAGGEDVEALLARLVPPLAQLVPMRHRRHRVRLPFDRHALAAVDVLLAFA